MKWTTDKIARAREILLAAPTRRDGCVQAAAELGTTVPGVSAAIDRGLLGRFNFAAGRRPDPRPDPRPEIVVPEPARVVVPDAPPTLHASLSKYADALAAKAEDSKIRTLERDNYALREAMETLSRLTSTPLEPVKRRELRSGLREGCAVAMLSDAHVEEHVRLGETPYPNIYNPGIAERSLARFFGGVRWMIDFHRHAFKIRDCLLWLGGDLMTGHIHPENVENTETPPIETLLWLRPRLKAGIDELLADPQLERLIIPCSYGNHGRNTPKPYRALGATHSYEWMLYQWLASHYEGNPRVRFLADQSAHQYARVFDFDLHFHHGDETAYGGGVGGITIPLNKAVAQWDIARRCHYHHFGHWHQYLDTGRITVNGSVIGYSAYGMSVKATPEPPQQAFYVLDSKRGKTCKSPIWVRETSDMPKGVAA